MASRDQLVSPNYITAGKKDDLLALCTVGCRAWVRPPGRRAAKLTPNSRKGIFLGFTPNADKNIIWHDTETHVVKIAKHVRFDEGMNDLPPDLVPPNVVHLQRTQNGEPKPDRSLILPVLHALQGHPESGKLWEKHIAAVL